MTLNKTSITRTITTAVAVFVVITALFSASARAGEKDGDAVRAVLEQRVRDFCRPLVQEWLTSQNGINDPAVKARAADCWLAHARLSVLGYESGLDIAGGASIAELPARILESKAKISLDPFLPLAGRTLEFPIGKVPAPKGAK
jgi:hypothetical protein